MVDIDTFQSIADKIVDELPEGFFRKLNGGVLLIEESKLHAQSRPDAPLYIMGEYCFSSVGRSIKIYYGSFERTYPNHNAEEVERELRKTILHEFRHHLEGLSGTRELEMEDKHQINEYLRKHNL